MSGGLEPALWEGMERRARTGALGGDGAACSNRRFGRGLSGVLEPALWEGIERRARIGAGGPPELPPRPPALLLVSVPTLRRACAV